MWELLEWIAWAAAAMLLGSMLLDAFRIEREYSEEVLLSSREGVDELIEHGDVPEANGGHRA